MDVNTCSTRKELDPFALASCSSLGSSSQLSIVSIQSNSIVLGGGGYCQAMRDCSLMED